MARTVEASLTSLNSKTNINVLMEFSKDYCSDHLGRFFQNKYSVTAKSMTKFEIPGVFVKKTKQDEFAICVMMNNHIVDIKYFSDIFQEWENEMLSSDMLSGGNLDMINSYVNDERLLPVIKRFKKINDEIVVGRCKGSEFTPLN